MIFVAILLQILYILLTLHVFANKSHCLAHDILSACISRCTFIIFMHSEQSDVVFYMHSCVLYTTELSIIFFNSVSRLFSFPRRFFGFGGQPDSKKNDEETELSTEGLAPVTIVVNFSSGYAWHSLC